MREKGGRLGLGGGDGLVLEDLAAVWDRVWGPGATEASTEFKRADMCFSAVGSREIATSQPV